MIRKADFNEKYSSLPIHTHTNRYDIFLFVYVYMEITL